MYIISKFKLKGLREQAFLSQRELAEKAGLTQKTICRLETISALAVRGSTLRQLAEALGVEPNELLSRVQKIHAGTLPEDP